jgi:hypothetical protein
MEVIMNGVNAADKGNGSRVPVVDGPGWRPSTTGQSLSDVMSDPEPWPEESEEARGFLQSLLRSKFIRWAVLLLIIAFAGIMVVAYFGSPRTSPNGGSALGALIGTVAKRTTGVSGGRAGVSGSTYTVKVVAGFAPNAFGQTTAGVMGVFVRMHNQSFFNEVRKTDFQGQCTFANIPAGDYFVQVGNNQIAVHVDGRSGYKRQVSYTPGL